MSGLHPKADMPVKGLVRRCAHHLRMTACEVVLLTEAIIACRDRLANQQSNETLDINQAMQRWLAEFAYRRAVQEY